MTVSIPDFDWTWLEALQHRLSEVPIPDIDWTWLAVLQHRLMTVSFSDTDWVLLAVLGSSMLLGAWRGLVYEVLSVLGWTVSFYAAHYFAPMFSGLLPMGSSGDTVRYAAAFLLVFVAAVFTAGMLASLLKKLTEVIGLRPFDRTMGAVFGLVRGVIFLLAATVVMDMTDLKQSVWWQESKGAPLLTATLNGLKPMLPKQFAKYLN